MMPRGVFPLLAAGRMHLGCRGLLLPSAGGIRMRLMPGSAQRRPGCAVV